MSTYIIYLKNQTKHCLVGFFLGKNLEPTFRSLRDLRHPIHICVGPDLTPIDPSDWVLSTVMERGVVRAACSRQWTGEAWLWTIASNSARPRNTTNAIAFYTMVSSNQTSTTTCYLRITLTHTLKSGFLCGFMHVSLCHGYWMCVHAERTDFW